MADARRVDAWNYRAQVLAVLHNGLLDPGKGRKPWTLRDFHPCLPRRRGPQQTDDKAGFAALKALSETGQLAANRMKTVRKGKR